MPYQPRLTSTKPEHRVATAISTTRVKWFGTEWDIEFTHIPLTVGQQYFVDNSSVKSSRLQLLYG